jgi:DNA topoisomerase-3
MLLSILLIAVITSLTSDNCDIGKYWQSERGVKSGGNAVVEKFATQRKKVSSPLLHSIDTLQEQANKKFGFSSKQTLDLAQSLYEKHKATTYPRSDCQYLPISQLSEVKDVMTAISNT